MTEEIVSATLNTSITANSLSRDRPCDRRTLCSLTLRDESLGTDDAMHVTSALASCWTKMNATEKKPYSWTILAGGKVRV